MRVLEKIKRFIVNAVESGHKTGDVKAIIGDAFESGYTVEQIMKAVREGADEIGKLYEEGRYFISDLIMAGHVIKEVVGVLSPNLTREEGGRGKIVLGTIEGDTHDIGKQIVSAFLTSAGYEVYDLGVDVASERFVQVAGEVDAEVVAISVLFSVAAINIRKVVKELEETNMRRRVRVIVGGAAARKDYIDLYGVDEAVNDVIEGLHAIRAWTA